MFLYKRIVLKNTKKVIDRMKEVTSSRTYQELADILEIKLATIDNWKKRHFVPEKNLLKCVHLTNCDYDWLVTGEKKETSNSIVGNNGVIIDGGHGNNININISQFDHKEDIKEIIELLQYAPSNFLDTVKDKLYEFKKLSQF